MIYQNQDIKTNFIIKKFSKRSNLANKLAKQIGLRLNIGIKENGQASLAVSGGTTPVELFKHLSKLDIAWKHIVITLVDERWVEAKKEDSNEHLVRSYLLKNKAARATFLGMKNESATAELGAKAYEQHLKQTPHPFDVLILGMGNDGHTASLFPGSKNLTKATAMDSGKLCMAITPLDAKHERLTLTLPAILDSKQIFIHITGSKKYKIIRIARDNGVANELPIRFILRQQKTPVTIFWAP